MDAEAIPQRAHFFSTSTLYNSPRRGVTVSFLDSQPPTNYSQLVFAMKGSDSVSTTMQNRWMTLQEVAEYLQLSKDQIYRLAQRGRIPASKVGSRWRFRRERVDQWMEGMAVRTETRLSDSDDQE